MDVIKPIEITDARLTSTSVPATALNEWDAGTAYNAGDFVKKESEHNEYECLIANTGQDPSLQPVDGSGLPYWSQPKATNRWAMFDGKSRNKTTTASPLTVTITPGVVVNSIALLNFACDALNITAISASDGEVYNKDVNVVRTDNVADYYPWFFSESEFITDYVATDIPTYSDMDVSITMNNDSGNVELGEFVLGNQKDLGFTVYGTAPGYKDYSTKETDTFGNPTLVERGFAKRINYEVEMYASQTDFTLATLEEIRSTPVVWIGSEEFNSTIVYGWYKSFDTVLENFGITSMNLEVEELI